jgi:hypothetical protein
MGVLKNITSATTTTLITKGSNINGNIKKITIANERNLDTTTIDLYLDDGTNTYRIIRTDIPPKVTLVLNDNLSFNSSRFNLKLGTSGAGYELTVIIK